MAARPGRHDLALSPSLSAMLGFVKGLLSPFGGVGYDVAASKIVLPFFTNLALYGRLKIINGQAILSRSFWK